MKILGFISVIGRLRIFSVVRWSLCVTGGGFGTKRNEDILSLSQGSNQDFFKSSIFIFILKGH